MDILAQTLGLIAMGTDLYAATHKDDRRLKILIILAGGLFAVHFALLQAWAAVWSEGITVVRVGASLRWRTVKVSLFFMTVYALIAMLTVQTFTDIFPYAASIIGTYAMFHSEGFRMRLWFMAGQSLWLIYSALHYSIGGTILYALLLIGTARTGWMLFKDDKAKHAQAS